jgi:hypothetical protein
MIEMLPIAKALVADGRYEPFFYLFRDISEANLQHLLESGIRVMGPKAGKNRGADHVRHPHHYQAEETSLKLRGIRKRALTTGLSWTWFSSLYYWVKFIRQLSKSKAVLRSQDVSALLVMGDRHVGWETALVKAANDLGLPTMIVPFAMSDPDSDVEARLRRGNLDQYRVKGLLRRLISRQYPEWVRESDVGPLFFLPPGEALAAAALGMMPDLPWTIGGGNAQRMAVESPRTLKAFLREGIPQDKLVVTGKPSVDQIYESMQALEGSKLKAELGIPDDRPIILCSVPQLAEHNLLSWPEHWREIEFLFETLTSQTGVVSLLSLHPQSNPEDYRPKANKYGALIAPQRIYDLIPICDFLVATYSSVVVQAIGCGKPAVVVDFYGLDFTYYDDEPGVVVIKDRDAFAPLLDRLLNDPEYYQSLAHAQLARCKEWILLDGESTQRVLDELYQMLEK